MSGAPNSSSKERDPEWIWDDCDDSDWDGEGLEGDDELSNCHGFFESQSPSAVFVCGAVGSEDCDECPLNNWLGHTNEEIDSLEEFDE